MENENLKTDIKDLDEPEPVLTKPKKRKTEESLRLYQEAIKEGRSWRGRPPTKVRAQHRETLSLYIRKTLKQKIEKAAKAFRGQVRISEVGELALELGLEEAIKQLKAERSRPTTEQPVEA